MRFLQLRIFIEVKNFSETTQIYKKTWLCFSDPFFWGLKDRNKAYKNHQTNHLWGTLTSATMVFATVSPLMMVCTWTTAIFKGHGNQPTKGLGKYQQKVAMKWKTQWHSKPQILTSIRFYPSFLQLFCSFPSSSFLPPFHYFFWKTVLLPSFSYLLLAFCWSQLFLVPFPEKTIHEPQWCKWQISKHRKNQQKGRHVHVHVVTIIES